jgi:UPF0489 domain
MRTQILAGQQPARSTKRENKMGEHIIPFKGRNFSGAVTQNLLWKSGSVYLMDNHRAALWCWQQEIDLQSTDHSLLHIDRHYDALGANLNEHLKNLPNLSTAAIDEYLSRSFRSNGFDVPVIRWDNYLSIYLELFKVNLNGLICVTHKEGDTPNFSAISEPDNDIVAYNLDHWLTRGDHPWIVNIDLDYFFYCSQNVDGDEDYYPLFSEQYVDELFGRIKTAFDAGRIGVVTVCLTPDSFTPGWQVCIDLSERFFKCLGVDHPKI